jgi:carbon-monoxide dehydrogenase large subunit
MTVDSRPKLIGARVQRVEDPRLLTGNGAYVDDIKLPDMLHVAILRSDHAHAIIASIDTTEAAALPGVVGVFTGTDINPLLKPLTAFSRMPNYQATELRPLADGRVRYVGEGVCAVIAESRYIAEDAAALIDVDYEALPVIARAQDALDPDRPPLHEGHTSNVLVARDFRKGDTAAAMEQAAVRVSATFRMHRRTPVPIENRTYLADFDKGRRKLTLWSSTQAPGVMRDALAEAFDMPGNRVRVIAPDVGGGFGSKTSLYAEELLVSTLARKLGQPVKWTSDRLEDLTSTSQAFDETVTAELGVDADGNLLALTAEILGDVGAQSIYPWTAALEPMQVAGFLPGPYVLENFTASVRAVATNKPPAGPYRGVGRPAACFVIERLMDMAAAELRMDPGAFRRRNFVQPDQFPYRIGSGIVWDRSGFVECLDGAIEAIGYEALKAQRDKARAEGRWFGIGFASYAELTGLGSKMSAAPGMPINTGTESATIEIDATGAVTATLGIADHGQGLGTTMSQIIADELGISVADVTIVQGDTDAITHSTGTYASRSTVLSGGASHLAARSLREKLATAAAFLLDVTPAEINIEDGMIQATGTNRKLTFAEVGNAVYSAMGRFPPEIRKDLDLTATSFYDPQFGTTSSATHIAVVEIDPETLMVEVKRLAVAEDCGRVINPMIVDGQVHGGVAQGIGVALLEEMVHDDEGQCLSASLVDYVVPSAPEMPPMDVIHIEAVAEGTIGGYRGMGEGGTIGAPAAIANAIADAVAHLNIEITQVPITPERLFRLVEAAKGEN